MSGTTNNTITYIDGTPIFYTTGQAIEYSGSSTIDVTVSTANSVPRVSVDYAQLLTDHFAENIFWRDLANTISQVWNATLNSPTDEILHIRDTSVAANYAALNTNMLGFKIPNFSFSPDEFERLMKYLGIFYQTRGASKKFLDFLSFIKSVNFTFTPLYGSSISGTAASISGVKINSLTDIPGTFVWNGGTYFPTPYYDISYFASDFTTVNETQLIQFVNIITPIHLVLRQIVQNSVIYDSIAITPIFISTDVTLAKVATGV